MNKHPFLVTGLFIYSLFSWAGDHKGNGGDVVVCHSGSGEISSVEVLDSYEGREYYDLDSVWGSGSAIEQIKFVLTRFSRQDPGRAKRYLERATEFLKMAKFKKGVVFTDIPDSQHLFFPKGCEVEQVAVQKTPQFVEESRYFVQGDLWDRLDNRNKAILVLHEVVYREALEAGHDNSIAARYLVSLIGSARWAGTPLSDRDYFRNILLKVNLPYYLGALRLNIDEGSYVEDEFVAKPFISTPESGDKQEPVEVFFGGNKLKLSKVSERDSVTVSSGQLTSLNVASGSEVVELFVQGKVVSLQALENSVYFRKFPEGKKKKMSIENGWIQPVILKDQNQHDHAISGYKHLYFDKNDLFCETSVCF